MAPWSVKWQALASGGAGISLGAEPNGAGKTTLFNVTCGMLRPDRGRVLVDGAGVEMLHVLDLGRVLASGPPDVVRHDESVLAADLDRLGARDPVAARERALSRFGALLMMLGPIWVAVEYAISHSGQNSLQQRDAIIGALFGLSLCVAGTALFLRYSGGRVLRLWMARSALVTEQQNEALVAAVRAVREPEE